MSICMYVMLGVSILSMFVVVVFYLIDLKTFMLCSFNTSYFWIYILFTINGFCIFIHNIFYSYTIHFYLRRVE